MKFKEIFGGGWTDIQKNDFWENLFRLKLLYAWYVISFWNRIKISIFALQFNNLF